MAKKSEKIVFQGTGRRKESIARVRIVEGKGEIVVNGRTLDEYFGTDILKRIKGEECAEIRELISFEGNSMRLKSSNIAKYILTKHDFNEDVLKIINAMVNRCALSSYIPRCSNILRDLISFSNLRMLFNFADSDLKKKYVKFYENARKTEYYSKNQFFWIQYAIAVMDVKDYESAHIFLENASSLAIEKFSEDSYQVDNLRARLILEKTIYDNDIVHAYENFVKAHDLICSNKTTERHYPYRQTNHYIEYFDKFYKYFTSDQKVAFMFKCTEIQKRIDAYLQQTNSYERNGRKKDISLKQINERLKRIISLMANG